MLRSAVVLVAAAGKSGGGFGGGGAGDPCGCYALLEAETGTVLLESHGSDRLPCGAMAKLMTALLAAEQLEQGAWTTDTVLTATDAVTGTKGAVIWLTAGEEMTVGDLLKG